MPRIARIIAPGTPHHITQRGNRRMQTFFCDEDYQAYIDLMAAWCRKGNVEVWAYCLMPNHIHMIALPETDDSLRRAIGEAHRRFTRRVNFREGWRGHLWQGRFASFPLDEQYLLAAARYVELNPVRAKLAADPFVWRWSSAAAHLAGKDDSLVKVSPLLGMVSNWREFLLGTIDKEEIEKIRRHERTGRPLGSEVFIERLESCLERTLKRQKPGPKKRGSD
jgi:putative transposase